MLPTNGKTGRGGSRPFREAARATGEGEPAAAPDRDTRRELAKLTATYLNGVAVAIFAVGALTPVMTLPSGSIGATGFLRILGTSSMLAIISLGLHLLARRNLRKAFMR